MAVKWSFDPDGEDQDQDEEVQHHSHVTILAGGLMRSSGKDICWFSATKSHDEQRFPDPTFPARSQSSHPPAAIYIVGKKQFEVQGNWLPKTISRKKKKKNS